MEDLKAAEDPIACKGKSEEEYGPE
jgi:hypothetical protein